MHIEVKKHKFQICNFTNELPSPKFDPFTTKNGPLNPKHEASNPKNEPPNPKFEP